MKERKDKLLEGTFRADRLKDNDLEILEKLKNPPAHVWNVLNKRSKTIYRSIGSLLVKTKKLTELDLSNVAILATKWDMWLWAQEAINKKNLESPGTGYIQIYSTKATNISTEMVVLREAYSSILDFSKLFGFSFKDRYGMNDYFQAGDSNQMDLFDSLNSEMADMRAV